MIAAVLKRGEVRDALVSRDNRKLCELTDKDRIATSSMRRKAQLLNINPLFNIIDIRGNVDTRLQKLENGYCDAMIMAATGLQRLNYQDKITEIIDPTIILPAISQGAIAVEIRKNDSQMLEICDEINHRQTFLITKAERTFLNVLQGGCQIPIGCYSELENEIFKFTAYMSYNEQHFIRKTVFSQLNDAENTTKKLAEEFLYYK